MTASLSSFTPGTSGADCLKYYEDQLKNGEYEDYYFQKEGHVEMYGRGLDRLAPDGKPGADGAREFDRKAMMNLLEGKDASGTLLVNGIKNGAHRVPGYDLTFSPDKSVSVAWAAASPELRKQIEAVHDRAVRGALDHIQDNYSLANEGKGGADRVQADISAGIFRHAASRELEPQLHSHCVIPNMAVKADGKSVSLNTRELYQRQKEAGAIYRTGVADGMQELGFDVERKGDNFRLSGIPQNICDQYSTRREKIKDAMKERGTHGAKAAEIAALDTRKTKQSVSDSVLLKKWQGEMAEKGFTADSVEALRGREKVPDLQAATMPTQEEFLQKLTTNNSTFSKNDVWREAAVAAQGVTDRHGAASYAQDFLATKSPDVLRVQHKENGAIRYTSRKMYDLERVMVRDAGALRDSVTHQLDSGALEKAMSNFEARKGFSLSSDQRDALGVMILGGDFATVQGAAGTGKSASMEAAADAWKVQGFRVRGLAPSGKAAAELSGANIESSTIASALMKNRAWTDEQGQQHPPADPFTSKDVLLVDEAGMVDSRTMSKLTADAKAAGAKLVLVGDTKQLQAIGAGGAFSAQQKALGGADAELSTVQRQNSEWGKQMVTAARNGEAVDALGYLHERDALHITDDRAEALQTTVDKWRENYSHTCPGSSFMLANTNADVRALNDSARERLKNDGVLGGYNVEIEIENREGCSLGKREFLEGDRVVFGRNAKLSTGAEVKNGQIGTIEDITMDNEGQQYFSVRRDGLGDSVNVPTSEYKAMNHGYALTTHKAQGITANHVSVLAGGKMQDLHASYVQLSRMKNSADVSCSKDALEAEMMKHEPTDLMRDYAKDLAAKKGIKLPESAIDNFRICRDFINAHAPRQIEDSERADAWQRDISNLTDAMSRERIKETSLDYNLADERKPAGKEQEKAGGFDVGDQGENLGADTVKGLINAMSSSGKDRKSDSKKGREIEAAKQDVSQMREIIKKLVPVMLNTPRLPELGDDGRER
jgi:conjugative relaxase-like TrwC/TraI family protein